NPLPVTGGRDPEDMELARRIMPEAFRVLTFRAVLDEDFEEIAERLAWVQQAGAVSRWTGRWLTTFVTPAPLSSLAPSEERRARPGARCTCPTRCSWTSISTSRCASSPRPISARSRSE